MRLLYFSPVYAGSYAQRPHFMVRALLAWGVESVLWVNPYPCRLPRWQDLRRKAGLDEQGTPLDPRIRVLNVPALPIEPLPLGGWLNRKLLWQNAWQQIKDFAAGRVDNAAGLAVHGSPSRQPWQPHRYAEAELLIGVGRPSALALTALRELQPTASFFDAMDNFPEFHRGLSRRAMRCHEDAVAMAADLVVASSTFLADKFACRGLPVEKVLNACEESDRRAGSAMPPPLPRSLAPRSPVLGYLGCIGRWFDWPLVMRLAETMPQARIELVGPCVVAPPGPLPANVTLLPACAQAESGQHLARFSVGLIPFHQNALTAGVDPIKYYDYRAAGLPVLSTQFGEMLLRNRNDGVYFLDQGGDLAEAVSAALDHCCDATETSRFRRNNNWTARFRRSERLRALLPTLRIRRAA
jgi:hypothetical protein